MVWPLVIALAITPLTVWITLWPLRLAFFVSQPALDRLADRVSAGEVIRRTEWAGLFLVVGSDFDPISRNVGLITDANPGGRSGFVRLGPGIPPERHKGPFHNLDYDVHITGLWWYQYED
jgi:hypothetical protein